MIMKKISILAGGVFALAALSACDYLDLEPLDAVSSDQFFDNATEVSLEQYCNIELDEKWMYELASLYSKTGMSDLCVRTCDKIMLMFGLGKYVEKAMDLKLQYAPLNKYQMDLEENRDKYEARLREVEQEYDVGGFEPDSRRPGRWDARPARTWRF